MSLKVVQSFYFILFFFLYANVCQPHGYANLHNVLLQWIFLSKYCLQQNIYEGKCVHESSLSNNTIDWTIKLTK